MLKNCLLQPWAFHWRLLTKWTCSFVRTPSAQASVASRTKDMPDLVQRRTQASSISIYASIRSIPMADTDTDIFLQCYCGTYLLEPQVVLDRGFCNALRGSKVRTACGGTRAISSKINGSQLCFPFPTHLLWHKNSPCCPPGDHMRLSSRQRSILRNVDV
jgi:hypothetical protein